MKKILLLSQFFYPDKTGTGKILSELFFSLDENKFNTEVISSRQIYGDKTNHILSSYEKFKSVRIYRVFKSFKSKDNAVGRLYNYIVFFLLAAQKLYANSLNKDKNIIVSVSNPPIMPLLAAWLKKENNRVVYILHDLYPDIAVKMGVVSSDSIMARVMYKINKYIFLKVDKIVVLGRDMKKYLINNYAVPESKIKIISNWANDSKEKTLGSKPQSVFRIVYSGNIGRFHNLEVAVRAIEHFNNKVELIFVGEGAQKEYLMNLAKNNDNVKFLSFMNDDEYKEMLNSADTLLVSLEKDLSGLAVPSKFYTYLSVGKPIVCISEKSTEMAMLIEEHQCGFVVEHDNVEMFKQVIEEMMLKKDYTKAQGDNAFELFSKRYNKSIIIKEYEKFFESLF